MSFYRLLNKDDNCKKIIDHQLPPNDFTCLKELSIVGCKTDVLSEKTNLSGPVKLDTDEKSVGERESTSVKSTDAKDVDEDCNCN